MKLVMAIVRPAKVDDVTAALEKLNLPGLTVTEVRGHGRQKGHTATYRGAEYDVKLLPKAMIRRWCRRSWSSRRSQAITAAARTGEVGDGRVFVIPVESSTNIRTLGDAAQGEERPRLRHLSGVSWYSTLNHLPLRWT